MAENNEKKAQRTPTGISDALVCIAAVLVCSFWSFEKYMNPVIMTVLGIIAAAVTIGAWGWYSFTNGIKKKKWFPIFTSVYWLLPLGISLYSDSITDPKKFNETVYLAGEFSKLLGRDAVKFMPLLRNFDEALAVLIILALSVIFYFIGVSFVKNRKTVSVPEQEGN